MKFFTAFISILVFSLAEAADGNVDNKFEKNLKSLTSEFSSKFDRKLMQNARDLGDQIKEKCPDIEEKMENVASEMKTCAESVELGSDTFCSAVKKNFAKCTKPAADVLSSCMPNDSKDLPPMIQKAVLSLLEQVCHITIEELIELFNPCAWKKSPKHIPACKDLDNLEHELKNKLPSTALVCEILPKVKKCGEAVYGGECKNPITKSSWLKFYNAIDNAFKNECDSLNKA